MHHEHLLLRKHRLLRMYVQILEKIQNGLTATEQATYINTRLAFNVNVQIYCAGSGIR